MSQHRRQGVPSHATIVAYVALFAALATGGAYAAAQIGGDDIKDNAIRSNHVKNDQVKAGDVAQGAGLEAIALVEAGATPEFLPEVPERGFDSVTQASPGFYCLVPSGNLDPASDPPVITSEYNFSSGDNFTAMWDSASSSCDDGEYEIQTFQAETGDPTDFASFVIMVP